MTVTLRRPTPEALQDICLAMRSRDKEEIYALRYDGDPIGVAIETMRLGDFQWIAYLDETPVASIGAYPVWPGVWTAWAYGTDDWPKVALTLTRHVKRFMIPALTRHGVHRVQVYALAAHHENNSWLERIGAKCEATLDNFGKNGQRFVLYRWLQQTTE